MFQTTCVYIARSSERLLYDSCLDQLSQVVVARKANPSPSASQAREGRPTGADRATRASAAPAATVRLHVIHPKGIRSAAYSPSDDRFLAGMQAHAVGLGINELDARRTTPARQ
jgi:hypothetical protein